MLALYMSDVVVELNIYLYNSGQGIRNIKLVGQYNSSIFVEARAEASNLLFVVNGEFSTNSNKLGSVGRVVSLALTEFVKFLSCCCFSI